jgi:hypothetical protein
MEHDRPVARACAILSIAWLCCCPRVSHGQDRLWTDARINGQAARLAFDTGAQEIILFQSGAERLGLRMLDAQTNSSFAPPGKAVRRWTTAECELRLWDGAIKLALPVIELPRGLDRRDQADGVVGWASLRNNLFRIDALAKAVTPLSQVPEEAKQWATLRLRTDAMVLQLETRGPQHQFDFIGIDTGSPKGIALHPQRWRDWKASHPNQPSTIGTYFMPGAGFKAGPEVWADEVSIGGLVLTQVPVREGNVTEVLAGDRRCEGTLGMAALKRLDLVIDGKKGVAYFRLKTTPAPPYEHNRLGADFLPTDAHGAELTALVIPGTPAYEAGVRNGDVFLGVGGAEVAEWRQHPELPLNSLWTCPAGTRFQLIWRRGGESFKAPVVLRDILGP